MKIYLNMQIQRVRHWQQNKIVIYSMYSVHLRKERLIVTYETIRQIFKNPMQSGCFCTAPVLSDLYSAQDHRILYAFCDRLCFIADCKSAGTVFRKKAEN